MCGIGGFIGKVGTTERLKLKLLMSLLSTRGTDNTGVGILNNKNRITIQKSTDHANLFQKDVVIPITKKNTTVIIHARKSSVGGMGVNSAHPFGKGIYKKDAHTDPSEYVFSIVKNGTISNWKELLKKYNHLSEDYTKHITVDSDALGYILYTNPQEDAIKEILREYVGGAAFIIQHKDRLFVYKGASKDSSYSKVLTEERPLWMGKDAKGNTYFASEDWMLNCIDAIEIEDLPCNKLMQFDIEGNLISTIDIDRSNSVQKNFSVSNFGGGKSWDFEDDYTPNYGNYRAKKLPKNKADYLTKLFENATATN